MRHKLLSLSRWRTKVVMAICLEAAIVAPVHSVVAQDQAAHRSTVQGQTLQGQTVQGQTPSLVDLATITTDTGAFAPGHRDFTRYADPFLCVAAVKWTERMLRRGADLQWATDTMQHVLVRDTIGVAGTAAVARACGLRFLVNADTATAARWAMGDTTGGVGSVGYHYKGFMWMDHALAAQQDTLVRRLLAQRLTQATTPAAQDDVVIWGVKSYLFARPARVAAAESLVAQLDTHGRSHLVSRIRAHELLREFWARDHDRPRSLQEAERIMALGHDVTSKELHDLQYRQGTFLVSKDPLGSAFREAMFDAELRKDSMAVETLCRRGSRDYMDKVEVELYQKPMSDDYKCEALFWGEPKWWNRGPVVPFPRVPADFWFPLHAGAPIQPIAGKVTLLVGLEPFDNWNLFEPLDNIMFSHAAEFIRRALAKWGTQGLTVTVVAAIHGASSLDGVVPARQEAERARWFIQDYEHLPVNVMVQAPHDRWLPAPDGRRIPDTTMFEALLNGREGQAIERQSYYGRVPDYNLDVNEIWALVGPTGTIYDLGNFAENFDDPGGRNDPMSTQILVDVYDEIDVGIQRALSSSPAAPSGGTPAPRPVVSPVGASTTQQVGEGRL